MIHTKRAFSIDLQQYTLKEVINLDSWESSKFEIIEKSEKKDLPNIIDASQLESNQSVCLRE